MIKITSIYFTNTHFAESRHLSSANEQGLTFLTPFSLFNPIYVYKCYNLLKSVSNIRVFLILRDLQCLGPSQYAMRIFTYLQRSML